MNRRTVKLLRSMGRVRTIRRPRYLIPTLAFSTIYPHHSHALLECSSNVQLCADPMGCTGCSEPYRWCNGDNCKPRIDCSKANVSCSEASDCMGCIDPYTLCNGPAGYCSNTTGDICPAFLNLAKCESKCLAPSSMCF